MKKLSISLIICFLFALHSKAQLSTHAEGASLNSPILTTNIQQSVFSFTVMNSLTYLELNVIQFYQQEMTATPFPVLPQPEIRLLKTPRPLLIQDEEFPIWQKISRRIRPVDIPVWNPISITKTL